MTIHTMRLVLGIMFLILAGTIFTLQWIRPDLGRPYDPVRLNLGGFFALVFGGLNIARWYVGWSHRRTMATPVRTPLEPDPSLVQPEPPNQDLDFTKEEANGQA